MEQLKLNFESYIVNCDNNSPDNTNKIFNSVNTKTKKISILTNDIGKGTNIINFLKFCDEYNIDYAFMIDTDLKSFEINWIEKMLYKLENGYDFILPLYKRSRYEGNTTNHFVVPIIYALSGKFIRQPIGGDYGFNKKYIKLFNQCEYPNDIKRYGIDIYMLFFGISQQLNIYQVELGEKNHNPSFKKMKNIFIEVAKGLRCSIENIDKDFFEKLNINSVYDYNSISSKKRWAFYNEAIESNQQLMSNLSTKNDVKLWANSIVDFLLNLDDFDNEKIEMMSIAFMRYVILFWRKNKNKSSEYCEKYIKEFSKSLRYIYLEKLKELNLNVKNKL